MKNATHKDPHGPAGRNSGPDPTRFHQLLYRKASNCVKLLLPGGWFLIGSASVPAKPVRTGVLNWLCILYTIYNGSNRSWCVLNRHFVDRLDRSGLDRSRTGPSGRPVRTDMRRHITTAFWINFDFFFLGCCVGRIAPIRMSTSAP